MLIKNILKKSNFRNLHYMFTILKTTRKNIRKKSIVFKPSFKCFKNEKINYIQAFLKLENFTLSEHVYIILSYSILIERFRLKKKEVSDSLKNMPYINSTQ